MGRIGHVIGVVTTGVLLSVLVAACSGVEETQAPAETTQTSNAVEDAPTFSPKGTDIDVDASSGGGETQQTAEESIGPTATLVPLTSTPVTYSPDLTKGVDALVECTDRDEEYYLKYGPPKMESLTAEQRQCIIEELQND